MKWSFSRGVAVIAQGLGLFSLVSSGCGDGSTGDPAGPFSGRWSGVVTQALQGSNISVVANLRLITGAADVYQGDVSTNAQRCFTSAMAVASVTNNSLRLDAIGSGSASQQTTLEITGNGQPSQVVGLFSMDSELADCTVAATSFTLTHDQSR